MPKDGKDEAPQPTFYNHNARGFASHQLTVLTASNITGRANLSFLSNHVPAAPTPLFGGHHAEDYSNPMDMDIDDEVPPLLSTSEPIILKAGLPGINVASVPRKRYKNSVSGPFLFLFLCKIYQTPGYTSYHLGRIS